MHQNLQGGRPPFWGKSLKFFFIKKILNGSHLQESMIGFNIVERSGKSGSLVYEHCCYTSKPHEHTVVNIPSRTECMYTRENACEAAASYGMEDVVKHLFEAIDATKEAAREYEASQKRLHQLKK